MLEKIIEVYATCPDGLDFSQPAFDVCFYQGGSIQAKCHDHKWSDLEVRIVFDIKEQLRPRGELDQSSAKAVSQFQVPARKVKLPPSLGTMFEGLPAPRKELSSFQEMLGWLEAELTKVGLGFRVTSPGTG